MNRIINNPYVPFRVLDVSDGFILGTQLHLKTGYTTSLSVLGRVQVSMDENMLVLPVNVDLRVTDINREITVV